MRREVSIADASGNPPLCLSHFANDGWPVRYNPQAANPLFHALGRARNIGCLCPRNAAVPVRCANSRSGLPSLTNSCLYSMAFALAKPLLRDTKQPLGTTASPIVLPRRPQ